MAELWDQKTGLAKDLILTNKKASQLGISKMQLQVCKFSVLDKNGKEFAQGNFPKEVELTSRGIETQFYVRKESTLKLDKGTYTTFRFYLESEGNTLVYSDRSKEVVSKVDHIDFDLKNELILDQNQELLVAMRFDFPPFSLMSYFGSLQKVFKRTKRQTGKLINSLAS
jgi:hypothetical protein